MRHEKIKEAVRGRETGVGGKRCEQKKQGRRDEDGDANDERFTECWLNESPSTKLAAHTLDMAQVPHDAICNGIFSLIFSSLPDSMTTLMIKLPPEWAMQSNVSLPTVAANKNTQTNTVISGRRESEISLSRSGGKSLSESM